MQHALPSPLRIHSIIYAAEGVLLFDLRDPHGAQLAPFTPGAHVDLRLPGDVVRSYSLVGDARQRDRYLIGVKRDASSRGGSAWLHASARAGDILEVGAPRNNFALDEAAPHSVLIAGGIGITPLWSMVRRLEQLQRPWSLHYRSRNRAQAPFLSELQGEHTHGRVHLSFSDEGAPRLDLRVIVREAPVGAHFYACGPSAMLETFRAACDGIEPQRVHLEHFAPPEEAARPQEGFTVRLGRGGPCLEVPPGTTILQALEANGVAVTSSCREGLCGACETRVLEGTPDHRDFVLSPAQRSEGRTMMVCCSRSLTPGLTLDLAAPTLKENA